MKRFALRSPDSIELVMDDVTLGASVRKAREAAGISGREMARAVRIDPASYNRSEAGARGFKALELLAVADRLNVPLDALVSRPAADNIAAGRLAHAAGEAAVEAVATWLAVLDRALALAVPEGGLIGLSRESREKLHTGFGRMARSVLPRRHTVAVTPGLTAALDDVLRIELPKLIQMVEVAPGETGTPDTAR